MPGNTAMIIDLFQTNQPILTQPIIGAANQPNVSMSHSSSMLSETIKIAELAGQQEIKIKLKQSEALPGPKVGFLKLCLLLHSQ